MLLKKDVFEQVIKELKSVLPKSDRRPILTYINLKVSNGLATFLATNSFILKTFEIKLSDEEKLEEFEINFIPFFKDIQKGSFIEITGNCIKYKNKFNYEICFDPYCDEKYPDTSKINKPVLNDEGNIEFSTQAEHLQKYFSGLKDSDIVKFTFNNKSTSVLVSTKNTNGVIWKNFERRY